MTEYKLIPQQFEMHNAEIKKRLPIGDLVWRNFLHKRFAVINNYINSVSPPNIGEVITDVYVSNIRVAIANQEMYEEVGQQIAGGGIWPVSEVVLVNRKEMRVLQKVGLL